MHPQQLSACGWLEVQASVSCSNSIGLPERAACRLPGPAVLAWQEAAAHDASLHGRKQCCSGCVLAWRPGQLGSRRATNCAARCIVWCADLSASPAACASGVPKLLGRVAAVNGATAAHVLSADGPGLHAGQDCIRCVLVWADMGCPACVLIQQGSSGFTL